MNPKKRTLIAGFEFSRENENRCYHGLVGHAKLNLFSCFINISFSNGCTYKLGKITIKVRKYLRKQGDRQKPCTMHAYLMKDSTNNATLVRNDI